MAAAFKIESMPTVKFIRGGVSPTNVIGEIQGGGPQFLVEFSKVLNGHSTPKELTLLRKFLMNAPGENVDTILRNMSTTEDEVQTLATNPLQHASAMVTLLNRGQLGMNEVDPKLAFDVTQHEASKTAVAHSVLERIKDDVAAYANTANLTPLPKILRLSDTDITDYFSGVAGSEEVLSQAHKGIVVLLQRLYELRDSDSLMVADTIPLIERASNWVNVDEEADDNLRKLKTRFCLGRSAGLNSFVWIEFLFGVLISSKGEEDLLKLNPYLPRAKVDVVMNLVSLCMLRSNRLGHTNRCIGMAISLISLLKKVVSSRVIFKIFTFFDRCWVYHSQIVLHKHLH